MKKILSKPITISVFREGESPIYSENAFHITVSDLAKIRLVYVNENGRELGKKSETGVRIGTVRGDAFCNGRKRKTGV